MKSQGFTLIELMIVLTIASLLLTIAIPSYTNSVQKSRRADAKSTLMDISARQERFMAQNNSYTTELSAASGLNMGQTTSSESFYNITVSNCGTNINSCCLLTATATGLQTDDERCATLTLSSTGLKASTDANNAASDCW